MKKTILAILICSFTLLGTKIMIKENVEKSFYGKIVEIGDAFLIVQPNEDEKEAEFSNRYLIDLQKDAEGYELGDTVKVTYAKKIDDAYPPNIISLNVELKPSRQFKLVFNQSDDKSKRLIIDKEKNKKYAYDVYTYGGDTDIVIKNKTYSLKDALKNRRISIDQIIDDAAKNCEGPFAYNDGGSKEYHCKNYVILKFHTIGGNRDVYIGDENFSLYDVSK